MILEIAASSVASALAAQGGGAGRVELCTALELGGLTPSHAQIALTREKLAIPLYVLIRPRGGDFVYNDMELETMRRDIEACVTMGCDGVVVGVLHAGGDVDVPRCQSLMDAAGDMGITFHRAFDLVRDPSQALEDLIVLGCERVLTSGAQPSAPAGAALIGDLVAKAGDRIAVMPGAGINAGNILALAQRTQAREFHASAKQLRPSLMHQNYSTLDDMHGGEWRSDEAQVRQMVAALERANAMPHGS